MSQTAGSSAASTPPPPAPRPWWRLHKTTLVVVAITLALAVLWNVSGFVRFALAPYATLELHYGWPCTFVRRNLGMNPDGSVYKPWALHEQLVEFNPGCLAANVAIAACLAALLAAVVEFRRRRRPGRRFQITLRQLAVSFVVLAAAMAWWVSTAKEHRRKKAALVELWTAGNAGVFTDHGMPHWLRPLFAERDPKLRASTFQGDFLPFDRVRGIGLAGPNVAREDFEPLADCPHVVWLQIWCNNVRDDDFRHLRGMSELEVLECGGTSLLTDKALGHLAGLSRLRTLQLGGTQVTDEGMKHLRGLAALERLELQETQVGDAGLRELQSPEMRLLSLSETQVGDAGLKHVASMRKLELLMLYGTNVTDAGLPHLYGLSNLQYIDLRATGVTPAGVEQLHRALPNLRFGPSAGELELANRRLSD